MKRSREIVLVLSGAVGVALTGCGPEQMPADRVLVSSQRTYTNNHYLPGVGYYHAPYGYWCPLPYNTYEPGRGYYHGGTWSTQPDKSIITASQPSGETAQRAQASHDNSIHRGGFGGSRRGGYS